MEKRKPRCHNCIHAGAMFKLCNLTHTHCGNPKKYSEEKYENGEFHPFDTIRVFSDTCEDHEFKPSKTDKQINDVLKNQSE